MKYDLTNLSSEDFENLKKGLEESKEQLKKEKTLATLYED